MTRILVLCHSSHGHVRTLAQAQAEGARSVHGVHVDVRRVPETVPQRVCERAGFQADDTPEATVAELPGYDAIILGTPTHFGSMAGARFQGRHVAQMAATLAAARVDTLAEAA